MAASPLPPSASCADTPTTSAPAIAPPQRIKPGTRLVRAWSGTVHTVTVVPGGFEYAGARYSSLSAIAKAITGSRWNGPVFFGLEGPARGAQSTDKARTPTQGRR